MPDRLPSVDAADLLRRHDALVAVLSDAAADDATRAGTKQQIIALYRDVERALEELALLKDDVKELVALWKVQPVLDATAPRTGPPPDDAPRTSLAADGAASVDRPRELSELIDLSAIEAVARAAAMDGEAREAAAERGARAGDASAVRGEAAHAAPAPVTFESGHTAAGGTSSDVSRV